MAKVKNTGGQPRGFFTEDGGQVVVGPGEEKEFNMSEADFKHLQETMEGLPDPKPFELSGSHGGVKSKKEKKEEGEEMPAQSTEPPTPSPDTVAPQMQAATGEQQKQKGEQQKKAAEERPSAKDEERPHRTR